MAPLEWRAPTARSPRDHGTGIPCWRKRGGYPMSVGPSMSVTSSEMSGPRPWTLAAQRRLRLPGGDGRSIDAGGVPSMSPILVREYRRAERLAGNIIHVVGIASGVIACVVLAILALPSAGLRLVVSISLYASGMMAMLWCSALYNMVRDGAWKRALRRLDHAAIFVMIAGTYTPFALEVIGGAWGIGLLAFVWTVAVVGVAMKLL